MRRLPNPSRSGRPTWAPIPTPFATAISTVVRITAASPPCQPQAMLAEMMTSISSASLPSCHRPKLSPMSEFKSIVRAISDPLQIRFVDQGFSRAREIRRFVDRELFEPDLVAPRHHLTQLPHRSVGNTGRADEATQRRSVDTEDDWLIAGDVHRTDRVAIVEDFRGVATRDAASGACPLPAIRLQPVAHAVGVAVELPVMAEEMFVVIPGPVVGRGLRSRHRLQLPLRGVPRDDGRGNPPSGNIVGTPRWLSNGQLIPFLERPTFETADRARHVGRATPEVGGHVDASAYRQVGAKPRTGDAAQGECLTGRDAIR